MPAPQYEQAGADIGGTGTTNTIPRWTGVSTLGDSVITQSGSNIGFGLGANAPVSRWHALVPNSGATPTASDWTGSFSASGDYRSGFGFQFAAGTAASNRVTCLVSNGTNTGQTVVWTADGSGNVGIGTTSPTDSGGWSAGRVLDVRSASAGSSSVAYFGDSTRGTNMQIGFYGSGYGFVGTVTNHALSLRTGNVERAQIDANGNIYGTSGTPGMTNGFFYIPAAAGAPTGTPTAVAGRVPMYCDTTNNKFYIYNGAWKAVTLT